MLKFHNRCLCIFLLLCCARIVSGQQQKNYFGYVVPLIRNEEKNIDILYDYAPKFGDKHFRVVPGDSYSHISFRIPGLGKSDEWHTIRLKFDQPRGLLTVTRDQEFASEKVSFPEKACYKAFFGANDYPLFRPENIYVQSITLNGKAYTKTYLLHTDILKGAC